MIQFKTNNNNKKAPNYGRASETENYIPKRSNLYKQFPNINVYHAWK